MKQEHGKENRISVAQHTATAQHATGVDPLVWAVSSVTTKSQDIWSWRYHELVVNYNSSTRNGLLQDCNKQVTW